jgi:hypothetical protein
MLLGRNLLGLYRLGHTVVISEQNVSGRNGKANIPFLKRPPFIYQAFLGDYSCYLCHTNSKNIKMVPGLPVSIRKFAEQPRMLKGNSEGNSSAAEHRAHFPQLFLKVPHPYRCVPCELCTYTKSSSGDDKTKGS